MNKMTGKKSLNDIKSSWRTVTKIKRTQLINTHKLIMCCRLSPSKHTRVDCSIPYIFILLVCVRASGYKNDSFINKISKLRKYQFDESRNPAAIKKIHFRAHFDLEERWSVPIFLTKQRWVCENHVCHWSVKTIGVRSDYTKQLNN